MKKLRLILITLALLGLSMSAMAQSPYIISGGGTAFTVTKDGTELLANKPIQEIIDKIKLEASGADCTIQFGNGTSTLNTGTANMVFDGGSIGKDWGLITFTGKLTSAYTPGPQGVISLVNGVSINSKATITNTAGVSVIIGNSSKGTVTISGGTITLSNNGIAVLNILEGAVNITGGVIEAMGNEGAAVGSFDGKITVSGDAVLTSKNTGATPGTILLLSGGSDNVSLEVKGGTVENTANNGVAIYNQTSGTIDISGGKVSATSGKAVYLENEGTVNISGGTVSATSGSAVYIENEGTVNISDGTVSTTTGTAVYVFYDRAEVHVSGGKVSTTTGIALSNGEEGLIIISGGIISATTGTAIEGYGEMNISGGTMQATESYNMIVKYINPYGGGDLNISGGTFLLTKGNIIKNEKSNVNITGGTFFVETGYAIYNNEGNLNISGGTISVKNICTIYNEDGNVTISGGIISATTGFALRSDNEVVNITGGIVFAYGTTKANVIVGLSNITGNGVVVAWDQNGSGVYDAGDVTDIFKDPTTATAVWAKQAGIGGIYVKNGPNEGFIPIADVTVKGQIFTVTFAGESVSIPPQEVEEGDLIVRPTDPERTGYDFKGWFTDNNTFLNEWDFDHDYVTGNMTLYAKWTPKGAIETIEKANITIYPNPTTGELKIENGKLKIENVEIYDVFGRKAPLSPPKGGKRSFPFGEGWDGAFDISHLPSGVYFVKITTDNGIVTKKIVKQ